MESIFARKVMFHCSLHQMLKTSNFLRFFAISMPAKPKSNLKNVTMRGLTPETLFLELPLTNLRNFQDVILV